MATNKLLAANTVRDIDSRVERLLADLGNPQPPLRLELVRELLRLDLRYYSSADTSWLEGTLHKLRIAGKQVLARPTLILDVVKKLDLKALVIPDQKRILIDSGLAAPKQRWSEAHEILHRVIPWHDGAAMGDADLTLSRECHEQIETEANYGAGQLLFLGAAFTRQLLDESIVCFDTVHRLATSLGNSKTTTLWRVVEKLPVPAFGLIGPHPRYPAKSDTSAARYFIRSEAFSRQFPDVTPGVLVDLIAPLCRAGKGPIGAGEVVLRGADLQDHVFGAECFHNGYDALSLGVYRQAVPTLVSFDDVEF